MFIDAQTRLWSSAALTVTAVSTNCYDLGAPFVSGGVANDPGIGEGLALLVNIEVAGLAAGTETYEFQVINASATDLTTGQIVIATTGTIATADVAARLAAGKFIVLPIPPNRISLRYLGAKIVTANSAGITVSASIQPTEFGLFLPKYYPQASTIS